MPYYLLPSFSCHICTLPHYVHGKCLDSYRYCSEIKHATTWFYKSRNSKNIFVYRVFHSTHASILFSARLHFLIRYNFKEFNLNFKTLEWIYWLGRFSMSIWKMKNYFFYYDEFLTEKLKKSSHVNDWFE